MKIGKQTLKLENTPSIINTACTGGPKEKAGPLSKYFDETVDDVFFGQKTFEKAESKFITEAINHLFTKTGKTADDIDYIFAGDLLNQCIASGYSVRDLNIPYFGIYGACSNMVEGLCLASAFVNAGYGNNILAATSSHYCSAERQFRMPLEQGGQKAPTSQWTVTGSGVALVSNKSVGPYVTYITTGKVIDYGIKDIANMGAAMAPAAIDTIIAHFQDTGRTPDYYDLIVTGDLGYLGGDILCEFCAKNNYDISSRYNDCGRLIYGDTNEDAKSGASGCGCCGTVFCGYLFEQLKEKKLNKILLVATGALMSTVSNMQGETIPSIAHAISIENEVN